MKRIDATPSTLGDLSMITGWAKLQASEQSTVTEQTMKAATALHNVSVAKIAVGESLSLIRDVLEPKRIFTKYLKTMFHMSKATAYRYIDLYAAAKGVLPKPILDIAMLRPDDRLTVKGIRLAPKPPRTTNVIKINEYLDSIQAKGPRLIREEKTPNELKKAMFHSIMLLLNKLPTKQRSAVFTSVAGMVLNEIGETNATIKAVPSPESFRATRGRPRKAA